MDDIFGIPPYGWEKEVKRRFFNRRLRSLTARHYENCEAYKRILDAFGFDVNGNYEYEDIPFLPVRLFKEYELRSVDKGDVVKALTSSGTSGQKVSRIFLDRTTSMAETKALTRILTSFIGKIRLPMLVIDSETVLGNRNIHSARAAGILGFSIFASDKLYALDEDMRLKTDAIRDFLEKHRGERVLIFGFTFMIWRYFCREILRMNYKPDLSGAILIHGGGWKKLEADSVSSDEFKKALNNACGIETSCIHDYYGMAEQAGAISMECECGYLHTSVFSDIIVRRPGDFAPAAYGEPGIIETVSLLPESYPGHVLLTEDTGYIAGEDDCPCGRLGKYFKIRGRLRNAELRGCSDTYAAGIQ